MSNHLHLRVDLFYWVRIHVFVLTSHLAQFSAMRCSGLSSINHYLNFCGMVWWAKGSKKSMELDLTPKTAEAVFEGDGGGYYAWSSSLLSKSNFGGSRFVLHPRGFALPHYADISKVGYVIQGQSPLSLSFFLFR